MNEDGVHHVLVQDRVARGGEQSKKLRGVRLRLCAVPVPRLQLLDLHNHELRRPPRQVKGAALGLIENGGGVMGFDEAACAVTILEKNK